MTTANDIDWPQVLAERLTTTHPDVLRELLATFVHTLMGEEADALCGATVDRLLHHAHVCQTSGDSTPLTQAIAGKGVNALT